MAALEWTLLSSLLELAQNGGFMQALHFSTLFFGLAHLGHIHAS
jgi:hypothetical protein